MSETSTILYPQEMLDDLAKSGLIPSDLRAKPLDGASKAATGAPQGVDGYVLPYFNMAGAPISFYRVKLFDQEVRYRQLADTPNHVYFPLGFQALFKGARYILITEGEKKAAACVKLGIPCIAFGGVDSWKSRTIHIPKDSTMAQKPSGTLSIRMPAGSGPVESHTDVLAIGLRELVDLAIIRQIPFIIAYDTETLPNGKQGVKLDVQRAAAVLGFELRHRGVPLRNIRQLHVPPIDGAAKTGLDDLLQSEDGLELLGSSIIACLKRPSAFPRHPNVKEYINKKLQKGNISRSEQMGLGIAILSDLDARGQRLRSPDEEALYYFSHETKALTKVSFSGKPDFSDSPFGRYLYQQYNIGLNDSRLLGWLATQFSSEDPISEVYPEKVLTWRDNTLYYHINHGTMARVRRDMIDLVDNGTDNVLFEDGVINDIPTKEFGDALRIVEGQPIQNWWLDVLKDTRVKDDAELHQKRLLSLLYYISPMFYRWKGTQLPVEITTGEAGSGKSTLFELRLSILTGVPKLRNSPSDLRDWNSTLASAGALYVTDNVAFANNDLRQKLSDEICRLVTEPHPTIEQRKLYTDTGLVKIPVRCVFGITAIKQPFQNIDIIQRSLITQLDKGTSSELTYDDTWKERQLESRGGRSMWLAHQLVFAQHMLQVIERDWDSRYKARYRLINLEQLLLIAARIIADPQKGLWIPAFLENSRDKRATETDWALEGLKAFTLWMQRVNPHNWDKLKFKINVITNWAEGDDDFLECNILTSTRMLARYIGQHKHTVATTTGLMILDENDPHVHLRIQHTGD